MRIIGRGNKCGSRAALRNARLWYVFGRDANGVNAALFGPTTEKNVWAMIYKLGGADAGYSAVRNPQLAIADKASTKIEEVE